MTYEEMATDVAKLTGYPVSIVKEVLWAVPDALVCMTEGDQVRTPLGVFSMNLRKGRPIRRPGGEPAQVEEKLIVRLKPGLRLQKSPPVEPEASPSSPEPPPEVVSETAPPQP